VPPAVRPLDMPQAGHMRVTCSPEGCGLKEHGRVERKGVEQAVGGRSGDRKGECVQPEESTVVLTSGYCTTRRSSAAHLSVARDSSRCPPLSVAIACTRALPPSRSPTRRTSFPPRHGTCWVRWPRRASAWWPRRAESDEDCNAEGEMGQSTSGLGGGRGRCCTENGRVVGGRLGQLPKLGDRAVLEGALGNVHFVLCLACLMLAAPRAQSLRARQANDTQS